MEVKTKQKSGKEHNMEKPELLSGNEKFCLNGIELGFTVRDYWQFQFSNLIDNLGMLQNFLLLKPWQKMNQIIAMDGLCLILNIEEKE